MFIIKFNSAQDLVEKNRTVAPESEQLWADIQGNQRPQFWIEMREVLLRITLRTNIRFSIYRTDQADEIVSMFSQWLKAGNTQRIEIYFQQTNLNDRHVIALASLIYYGNIKNPFSIAINPDNHVTPIGLISLINAAKDGNPPEDLSIELSFTKLDTPTLNSICTLIAMPHKTKKLFLELGDCQLGDTGAIKIANALRSCRIPKELTLGLRRNNIADAGIQALILALSEGNTSNITLQLYDNKITPKTLFELHQLQKYIAIKNFNPQIHRICSSQFNSFQDQTTETWKFIHELEEEINNYHKLKNSENSEVKYYRQLSRYSRLLGQVQRDCINKKNHASDKKHATANLVFKYTANQTFFGGTKEEQTKNMDFVMNTFTKKPADNTGAEPNGNYLR